ncbi:Dyp-type peroxidase, partial [Paenibacillus sp. MCAF20]
MLKKPISRRDLLRMAGVGGAGLLFGASGMGGVWAAAEKSVSASVAKETGKSSNGEFVDFYGKHQAGITTPAQDFLVFAAFDLTTESLADVKKLFQTWTKASAFGGDELREEWSGGDIGVQVNANDLQIAFHAIRNLARLARGKAVLRWTQEGFQRTGGADPSGATPRNLMGFKDGTNNPDTSDDSVMNKVVWASASDGAGWMEGGTYMVVRRIRIRVEVWDRSTLGDQEATFGRHRASGAPLGGSQEHDAPDFDKLDEKGKPVIPVNAHMRLARGDGSIQILRRSYSYSSGMDHKMGQLDAGLLFICFNRDTSKQFTPMQKKLGQNDLLNEYIVHVGS